MEKKGLRILIVIMALAVSMVLSGITSYAYEMNGKESASDAAMSGDACAVPLYVSDGADAADNTAEEVLATSDEIDAFMESGDGQ